MAAHVGTGRIHGGQAARHVAPGDRPAAEFVLRPTASAFSTELSFATGPASSATSMLAHLAFALALSSSPDRQPSDSVRSDRDIRLAALRHVSDVKRCYEREGLTRNPALTGTVDVTVTVLATGVVRDASITTGDLRGLGAREVANCLTTAIRNWRFDRGPYAVETIVFPFRFSPIAVDDRRIATG